MSSYNLFAALTSPAPAPSIVSLFRKSSILAGSKCPYSSTQSPPTPASLPVPTVTNPRPQNSDYSVFDVLNLFQSHWYINCEHLIANVLSATRDLNGQFMWVDFLPVFHTALIKRTCTLLPSRFTVAHSKQVLFVFLLEILTGDKGPKPKVFWRACKKRSQASQEVCRAMSQGLLPAPYPPLPSLVPDTSPEPLALAMLTLAPSASISLGSGPLGSSGANPDNVVMEAVKSSLPLMASPEPYKRSKPSNQAFTCMFLQDPTGQTLILSKNDRMKQWLTKARRWGFNIGQVLNAVQAASRGGFIGEQFGKYLDANFMNLVLPGPDWSLSDNKVA
jgi:hypothetical protein